MLGQARRVVIKMKKIKWIWIVLIVLIGFFTFKGGNFNLFSASGGNKVVRTFSSTKLEPGEELMVTYTPPSGTQAWAVEQPVPDGWGNEIRYYSTEDAKKTYTLTAPSEGTYDFYGNYWIAEEGEKVNFGRTTVTVLKRNTEADTNYDGCVSFSEFTTYANLWVEGKKTFDQFIESANAWTSQEGCY